MDRFFSKIEFDPITTCWEWTAYKTQEGYGQFHYEGKACYSHRLSYERIMGTIPKGKELDHLCRNRRCCNPEHLEVVNHKQNLLRGNTIPSSESKQTHCPRGHILSGDNLSKYELTIRKRSCKSCKNERRRMQ